MMQNAQFHQVVIIGGGLGGLYAAKAVRRAPVRATLVDKRNFHLFQPLLYQVATGSLAPGDIAYPLRSVFAHDDNLAMIMAEVIDIDVSHRTVILHDGSLTYDTLIIATGASHQYFGHNEWAQTAPGLKTIEDAPEIRRRIFSDFEMAEREPDPERRRALAAFVIVDCWGSSSGLGTTSHASAVPN
jgi:NADH:ubiquinone reductase (H+-translocating)